MYLLDTNILIYAKNRKSISVREKIKSYDSSLLNISLFTVAELLFGCAKSSDPIRNKKSLMEFLLPFNIINFEQQDCDVYGKIRAFLEKNGKQIGTIDTFIGSLALSRNMILVTSNVKEFNRIPGLQIEDWSES